VVGAGHWRRLASVNGHEETVLKLLTTMFLNALAWSLVGGVAVPAAEAEPAPVGTWTIETVPPISVVRPRGKAEGTVVPIALVITKGPTPLRGTIALWRGDVHKQAPIDGTFAGNHLMLRAAGFSFKGTYDPKRDTVTGTVLELPHMAPPDGQPTRFVMTRSLPHAAPGSR
jgi:hypothetical protein